MSTALTPAKALIFRIVHLQNLPWILRNGLHCVNAGRVDPGFVAIGNPDLIDKRSRRALPTPYGGVLSDYVPFYFTPFSPMMYNIRTGWGGVPRRANDEIVILVSFLWKLKDHDIPFVFTDRHAYLQAARFFTDPARLGEVDWDLLRSRDFRRDPNDPARFERYEAEALALGHVPTDALLGVTCFDESARARLAGLMSETGVTLATAVRPGWYFR